MIKIAAEAITALAAPSPAGALRLSPAASAANSRLRLARLGAGLELLKGVPERLYTMPVQ